MDKITKFLKKLSKKEREIVYSLIERLHSDDTKGLDIRKLKDKDGEFRIRKGRIRITYTLSGSEIFIKEIEFRSEKSYK